jgi:hypothetical protein
MAIITIAFFVFTFLTWFTSFDFSIIGLVLVAPFLFSIVLVPAILVYRLYQRASSFEGMIFIAIFSGVVIEFVGLTMNFQPVELAIGQILSTDAYIIYKAIGLFISLFGFILITGGFLYLPPLEGFLWIDDLLALYVIDSNTSQTLYKKIFTKESPMVQSLEAGGKDRGHIQQKNQVKEEREKIFLGGIGSINDILSELITTPGQKLEFIDQGTIKLLLAHEDNMIFLITARQKVPVFRWKLYNFMKSFMFFFGDSVNTWNGDPNMFSPVDQIVKSTFNY